MVMQSSLKAPPLGQMNGNLDEDFEKEIEALIREQRQNSLTFDIERDEFNIFRSGSAPPTVEGSRTAFGNLSGNAGIPGAPPLSRGARGAPLTEEDMRAHPAYLSYYYSNDNLNPRLPPPVVSKEDWRARQRAAGSSSFGKIGDRRRNDSIEGNGSTSSLSSLHSGEREMLEKNLNLLRHQSREEWLERSTDELIGLPDVRLGTRRKSFADALQSREELGTTYGAGSISRPNSRNAYSNLDPVSVSDLTQCNGSVVVGDSLAGAPSGLSRVHSIGSSISNSFASVLCSSIARSTTPDTQFNQRSASPCFPPVGLRTSDKDKLVPVGSNGFGGASSRMSSSDNLVAAMTGLSISKDFVQGESHGQYMPNQGFSDPPELHFNVPLDRSQFLQHKVFDNSEKDLLKTQSNHFVGYNGISKENSSLENASLPKLTSNGRLSLTEQSSHANIYKKASSDGTSSKLSNDRLQNADISGVNFIKLNSMVYSGNHGVPSMVNNQLDLDEQYLNRRASQMGTGFQLPLMESLYAQYLNDASDAVSHGAFGLDPSLGRSYLGASHLDFSNYHHPYAGSLLNHQRVLRDISYLDVNRSNYNYFLSHAGMPYPGSSISSSIHSSLESSPVRQKEHSSRVHSVMRNSGESMMSWSSVNGTGQEGYAPSLLEELKSNKTKSFELSDIVGHVVEFSADQYGSRFIQQKLETASIEEKNKIFPEIFPEAHSLMTDVFGNYVIQKFFEHGTQIQRKQLASQLMGHVLPLSLQMYGCRVIQKALEVVDVDEQTQMVLELNGRIMKCVHDQNGNHVIQKCIECVAQEKIQFIIEEFYGHIFSLSTHPYGCRVIQRVLEHCDDPTTQCIMMDEILQSVSSLSQDQYGNYVIQHVLQHGKPEERSAIITKISGQIVKMSQQKYASNVIEKCLTYGTPEARQLIISEMLGSTDENEPLQAMMKDQFANYVVQKVLETCDEQNRELILSRIKVHLNALKKYTYGKHIVARVEKLITAGEKRMGSSNPS